ncbi:MAG: hypothetical protein KJ955_06025 [Nanoarchaeota archaeon]|nr:hypothetical protein [Nanoarchaeota archaeon]
MVKKDKSGIESIVEGRQKKDIVEVMGTYAGTVVSGMGAAGSAYMFVFSAYNAISEYIKVDPSMVIAAEAMDDYSPYSLCHIQIIMALMVGIATMAFVCGIIEGIKKIRE